MVTADVSSVVCENHHDHKSRGNEASWFDGFYSFGLALSGNDARLGLSSCRVQVAGT